MVTAIGTGLGSVRSFTATVLPGFCLLLFMSGSLFWSNTTAILEAAENPLILTCILAASYVTGEVLGAFERIYTSQLRWVLAKIDKGLVQIGRGAVKLDYFHTHESRLYPIARERVLQSARLRASEVTSNDISFLIGGRVAELATFSQVEILVFKARMLSRLSAIGVPFCAAAFIAFVRSPSLALVAAIVGAFAMALALFHASEVLNSAAKMKAWSAIVLAEARACAEGELTAPASSQLGTQSPRSDSEDLVGDGRQL